MSIQPQDGRRGEDRLVPISDAVDRLGRSVWTLKRMHRAGCLPAVIMQGKWSVPESFITAVLASPRPGQAGVIEDIARDWFAKREIAAEAVA